MIDAKKYIATSIGSATEDDFIRGITYSHTNDINRAISIKLIKLVSAFPTDPRSISEMPRTKNGAKKSFK